MSFGIYLVGYIILIAGQSAARADAMDRGGYPLFDRRCNRPWRDRDPTKRSTVLGVGSRLVPVRCF
jgi:hypothetical protein